MDIKDNAQDIYIAPSLGIRLYEGGGTWQYDVQVESAALDTTGGRVWDAARRLATYLETEWSFLFPERSENQLPGRPTEASGRLAATAGDGDGAAASTSGSGSRSPSGLRVLELGAGLGWLGMTLARNAGRHLSTVCLTEQRYGGAVSWLRHNVDMNKDLAGVELVKAIGCDWNDFEEGGPAEGGPSLDSDPDLRFIMSQEWDLIIGSDLVYNAGGARLLPRVMRALAGPRTVVLYGHTKHRFDVLDMDLWEAMETCGLSTSEVHESGLESPPPSPPPLTCLFPEMRIAVYRIRRSSPAN